MRIADYFDGVVDRQPDLPALIEDDTVLDFAQARRFVHAAAHALQGEPGLALGAHIALYAPSLNWDAVSSMVGQYLLGLEPKGQY